MSEDPTAQSGQVPALAPPIVPGVLVLWSRRAPTFAAHRLARKLVVGRSDTCDVVIADDKVSRRHAAISYVAGGFLIEDLGSKRGTSVDGVRIDAPRSADHECVVQVGDSVLLLRHDIVPHTSPNAIAFENGMVVSPYLLDLRKLAATAATAGLSTLVSGPTGTGKERIARWFHDSGPRRRGPFVEVAAPTLDPGRADLELFGSRRGAFTGAVDRKGLIEHADGGTLFIDEFGDLSAAVQTKLLRVLQERVVTPLGANEGRKVDFVLVAATKIDLEEAIARGEFRDDLEARVAQVTIRVEPLSARRDEIPMLVATEPTLAAAGVTVTAELVAECMLRAWPKNIRDLRNALTNAFAQARSRGEDVIDVGRLPPRREMWTPPLKKAAPDETWSDLERSRMVHAIRQCGGNATEAARQLGVHKQTFHSRMKKYGLK